MKSARRGVYFGRLACASLALSGVASCARQARPDGAASGDVCRDFAHDVERELRTSSRSGIDGPGIAIGAGTESSTYESVDTKRTEFQRV